MFFEDFAELNDKLVYIGDTPEQYKSAIVGISHDYCHVIYSYYKLMEAMMAENSWSEEEAEDWLQYNTVRGCEYMGENRPIIVYDLWDK